MHFVQLMQLERDGGVVGGRPTHPDGRWSGDAALPSLSVQRTPVSERCVPNVEGLVARLCPLGLGSLS